MCTADLPPGPVDASIVDSREIIAVSVQEQCQVPDINTSASQYQYLLNVLLHICVRIFFSFFCFESQFSVKDSGTYLVYPAPGHSISDYVIDT